MSDELTIFGNDDEELDINEDEDFFPVNYDYSEVFEERIYPMVKTLLNICNEYSIPMLTVLQYKNTESQTMLCTSVVHPPKRTCDKLNDAMKQLLK